MEAAVRLGERREFARLFPRELAAVHQQTAYDHTVPRKELGGRVVNEIGAVVERAHEVWRRERRIDE